MKIDVSLNMQGTKAVLEISLISLAFAVIHSVLVADSAKRFFRRLLGEALMRAFYRLAYTMLSIVTTLGAMYLIVGVPDTHIITITGWPGWIMRALQVAGILIGALAFREFDAMEFLGARQAWLYIKGKELEGDIEGLKIRGMVKTGVYGVVRNPLYLAGILIFTFQPSITRTWLTVTVLANAYFIFGALIEQRRMLRRFGEEYRQYMKEVPLLIPRAKPWTRHNSRKRPSH